MSDEVVFEEATVVASKIRSVDRELDVLERERVESIVRGMESPERCGSGCATWPGQ